MNKTRSFLGVLSVGKTKSLVCLHQQLEQGFFIGRVINTSLPHKSLTKIAHLSDFTPLRRSSPSDGLETLIENLKSSMVLSSKLVEKAFRFVDRKYFIAKDPYCDTPPDLGEKKYGVCISSPRVHVLAAEILLEQLSSAKLCLDVGSGSGYFTLLMQVLSPQSQVFGIDYHADLINQAKEVLDKKYPLEFSKITFTKGDGKNGLRGKRFDVIHVGFMCNEIPIKLLSQLAIGGRMLIPVSKGENCSFDDRCLSGTYLCIDKVNEQETLVTELLSCSFVPDASKK